MLESKTNSQVLSADGEMPIRLVHINGIPYWQASGRTFPVVAGAEDPPPAPKPDDPPKPKEGEGAPPDGGEEFDKDRALATIKKLRDGEKGLKAQLKELDELKAKEQERANADKSESEKLAAKVAELTASLTETHGTLRQIRVDGAIEQAARKHNARNPAIVAKLLDRSALELDDDGNPTNAEDLVKALLKDEPYLIGKADGTNGTTDGVPPTPKGSDAGTITDDERRKKAVGIREYW